MRSQERDNCQGLPMMSKHVGGVVALTGRLRSHSSRNSEGCLEERCLEGKGTDTCVKPRQRAAFADRWKDGKKALEREKQQGDFWGQGSKEGIQ